MGWCKIISNLKQCVAVVPWIRELTSLVPSRRNQGQLSPEQTEVQRCLHNSLDLQQDCSVRKTEC